MQRVIVLSFILSFIISGCDQREGEIIIVPKNYTGYVVIIFNQKKGTEPKYEEENRMYEIPQNGILKTQFSANYGWGTFTEAYYEKIGPGNKIPFSIEPKNIPVDSVVCYGGSTGNAGEGTVEFKLFYVGNRRQIDHAYALAEKLDYISIAE